MASLVYVTHPLLGATGIYIPDFKLVEAQQSGWTKTTPPANVQAPSLLETYHSTVPLGALLKMPGALQQLAQAQEAVTSVFGRIGDVTASASDISGLGSAATHAATDFATPASVQAAIAALVNSSPAALDTLKELADALGDDAHFSTTVTNLLAAKAALASPAFTGSPTINGSPAVSQGTGDLRYATVAADGSLVVGGATVAPPLLTALPSAPAGSVYTALQRASREVFLEDYYLPADGNDWNLALSRALAVAVPNKQTVRLCRRYTYLTPITNLPNGTRIAGVGPGTGMICGTPDAPVTWHTTTGGSDFTFDNFTLDGGLTAAAPSGLPNKRLNRFISCTKIRMTNMWTKDASDWCNSFEKCTDVSVRDHRHTHQSTTDSGGRDGLHFLDCDDVRVDGVDGYSGDDLVSFTTQTKSSSNLRVANVTGTSDVASVLVFGYETGSTFGFADVTAVNISTRPNPGISGKYARYIVSFAPIAGSTNSEIRIIGVTGQSTLYGVQVLGSSASPTQDVTVVGVDVTSTGQHGVLLSYLDGFMFEGSGVGLGTNYDGVNVSHCTRGSVQPRSRGSATNGCQLNTCTNVDVVEPVLLDNGGTAFASNTGSNLRIVNCTTVNVGPGIAAGGSTTSYYGVSASTNTGLTISPQLRAAGATAMSTGAAAAVQTSASGTDTRYAPNLATTDPLVTSDSSAGYSVGSRWVNTAKNTLFSCVSAAVGAAVWQRQTADVQFFTGNGSYTWTKPAWAQLVEAIVIGNGGSGGSGAVQATGAACSGGAGGAGGGYSSRRIPAALVGATESVLISPASTPGAAQTTNTTAGVSGTTSNLNYFGNHVRAGGGAAGQGGQLAANTSTPVAGTGSSNGGAGAAGTNGAAGSPGVNGPAAPGGGSGGGISSGNAAFAGGSGNTSNQASAGSSGAAGAIGTVGGAGASAPAGELIPGTSGGGGGSSVTAGTPGGAGGAGGLYGAGGGGGGSAQNGNTSGAGGQGALGAVLVITI